MKTFLYAILSVFFLRACQASSETVAQPEDSLGHYPPTPASFTKGEYRDYHRKVSQFFDQHLPDRNFNGGILVAKDDAIIYEKYNGYTDLRKKDKALDETTPLHIASTSKTFTSMAILRLVQDGKMSLDDSLTKYFPAFPYHGLTVRMLLNHRSGLPNYGYYLSDKKVWDPQIFVTNQDVLNTLYNMRPAPTGRVNARFNYCNTNFVLLAMIIEKVSGQMYADYLKQNFFTPLGMTSTYVYQYADSTRAIKSFNAYGGLWQLDQFDMTYGDKNIYSTPQDLLKWSYAIHTGGIVQQQLLDQAFTAYSNERPSKHNYGLGFRLITYPNGKKVVYHNGRWHGYNSFFAYLPAENVTIIVLGNKYNSRIYKTNNIYDLFGNYKNGKEDEDDGNFEDNGLTKAAVTRNTRG